MRLYLAIVAAGGCGRFGFDPTSSGTSMPDAQVDADISGVFQGMELPAGGEARGFALMGNSFDHYYVAYVGGRVFRVDQGLWTECAPVPGDPFDLSVATDGTLYVSHFNDVSMSTDQCASFKELQFPRQAYPVAANSTDAYVGSYDGLWLYNHTGDAWSHVTTPFDGVLVNGIAVAGDRVGVAADTGFAVYHNSTWQAAVPTAPNRALRLVFDRSDPTRVWSIGEAGLFQSTNGGDTFTNVRTGFFDTLAVDPSNGQHLIAMSGASLQESFDGGVTFGSEKRTEITGRAWPTDVLFDPQSSGRVLLSMESGMFLANEASLQWARIDTSVHAWNVWSVRETPETRYVGTTGGLWSSQGYGPWSVRNNTLAQSSTAYGLTVSASNPDRVYVMGDVLARSSNRGADFSVVLPSTQTDGWAFLRLVEQGTRLWLGSFARLLHSDDDGVSWIPANLGGAARVVRGILVRSNGEIVAATDAGSFWSTDNGATFAQAVQGFTDASLRGPIVELADGRVLVATNDGIWAKTTAATSWTRIAFQDSAIHDMLVTPNALIVAEQDGVYVSKDMAATFQELPGLSVKRPHTLAIGVDNTLLVGTLGHGIYRTPLP